MEYIAPLESTYDTVHENYVVYPSSYKKQKPTREFTSCLEPLATSARSVRHIHLAFSYIPAVYITLLYTIYPHVPPAAHYGRKNVSCMVPSNQRNYDIYITTRPRPARLNILALITALHPIPKSRPKQSQTLRHRRRVLHPKSHR